MIGVIDYGLGNVQAFLTLYQRLGITAKRVRTLDDVQAVSKLVLPGVGAFDKAITLFRDSSLSDKVLSLVLEEGVPILGICVGMQMLGFDSEEGGKPGLGLIPGSVLAFPDNKWPTPHMGWNEVSPAVEHPLFEGIANGALFYFLHSYYFECQSSDYEASKTRYSRHFCSAISKQNIYGVQFHPEKSHENGMKLLKNFAEI